MEPDLDGFRAAMGEMRMKLGSDVAFFTKIEGTYPNGVAIDPETDKPFDPTIQPIGSAYASATARVGVYTGRLQSGDEDDAILTPVGWFEEGNLVFDVDPADYTGVVETATEVEYLGERYAVSDVDSTAIRNVVHRKLVFARRR